MSGDFLRGPGGVGAFEMEESTVRDITEPPPEPEAGLLAEISGVGERRVQQRGAAWTTFVTLVATGEISDVERIYDKLAEFAEPGDIELKEVKCRLQTALDDHDQFKEIIKTIATRPEVELRLRDCEHTFASAEDSEKKLAAKIADLQIERACPCF